MPVLVPLTVGRTAAAPETEDADRALAALPGRTTAARVVVPAAPAAAPVPPLALPSGLWRTGAAPAPGLAVLTMPPAGRAVDEEEDEEASDERRRVVPGPVVVVVVVDEGRRTPPGAVAVEPGPAVEDERGRRAPVVAVVLPPPRGRRAPVDAATEEGLPVPVVVPDAAAAAAAEGRTRGLRDEARGLRRVEAGLVGAGLVG